MQNKKSQRPQMMKMITDWQAVYSYYVVSCPEIALHSNLSGWRKKSQNGEKIPLVRIPIKDDRNQRCGKLLLKSIVEE